MFILKRQDVEISSIQHPKRDQQIPILSYQGQTFRLISVFNASQEEDAKAFWRDLTDNQGKACVLLEEPERYSVWGKIRLEQLAQETDGAAAGGAMAPVLIQASLLILQSVFLDVEDLLGSRQAGLFQKDVSDVFRQRRFPQADSPEAVKYLLTVDPLSAAHLPIWQEQHLHMLLQELHRLGREYFGNTTFVERAIDTLQDLPTGDRALVQTWLSRSPSGKLWQ